MDKIKWCIKTKIDLIEPNENLSKAYIKKAEDSLKAALVLKNNRDWEITSLYYAMYFSLYAILMKIGVKCETHLCTILFMKFFLKKYFLIEEMDLIERSQQARIDSQYYSDRNISKNFYKKMVVNAPLFMLRCKDVINHLYGENISVVRKKLNL